MNMTTGENGGKEGDEKSENAEGKTGREEEQRRKNDGRSWEERLHQAVQITR